MGRRVERAERSRERERAVKPARPPRSLTVATRSSPDWRGWIALAWVLLWGLAYVVMLLQARAPQVVRGIRMLTGTPAAVRATEVR